MARSAPAFVAAFLLVLALLTLDAAQGQQPFPPSTDPSDAEALHDVFRQWQLEGGAAAEDPCRKRIWSQSSEINASVTCNCPLTFSGNVTGYRNITEIPPALFNLTELVSLDLSNNNLSGSIPPEVGNLSKLETWHFNNNNLSGSFPQESSLLRNLKSLWIFDNNVEGLIPEFIQNFTSLTDLRIYGTKLQGPIPKNFSNLANLEILAAKKERTEEEKKFRRRAKYFLATQLVAVLVFLSLMGGVDNSELDDDDGLDYED